MSGRVFAFALCLVAGSACDQAPAVPPPATAVQATDIDAAMRDSVIDGAIAKLRELYVFPETAEAMALAIDRRRQAGAYDSITGGREFAALLTTHLREVSQDLHLRVDFTPAAVPRPSANPPNPADDAQFRSQMERTNCGFAPTQILEGNVGYLKFNFFAPPTVCGPAASAAMNSLQDVDALIIDMRVNRGGDPAMVAYVTTYLFAEPTHLNNIYNRAEDSTQEWWTLPDVPGARFVEHPVYVLTSRTTFSAAEEFSYNLRTLGRATLVGERTGGGAHPVRGEWLNERFVIGVPFARAINPITNTNWEGTGVQPHVDVPAAAALGRARALATAQLADAR